MKKMFLISAMALCIAASAFGARYRVSDAGIISYLNPGTAIKSGDIVDLGYRYGIAGGDIASNATRSVFTDGVWKLKRADTNAIALGANVYFNTTTNVTGTAGAGGYIGQCVEAVDICTSLTNNKGEVIEFVKVDIGAPQKQIIVGTDIQAYDATLDTLSAGLTSNKVWIGNSSGEPSQKTLSGLFVIDTGGVASASTTGAGMTNVTTTTATVLAGVAVASEIDVLDGITPAVAAAVTGLGSATVAPAVTNATVGGGVLSGVDLVVTNVVVSSSEFVYLDGASNIVTNTFVTAVTFETGIAAVSSPTITLESGNMVTAYGSPTTANFVTGITSNVVTAAKTLSTTTDSVIDSITPQTDTFVKP